jgi:hypothetical protein
MLSLCVHKSLMMTLCRVIAVQDFKEGARQLMQDSGQALNGYNVIQNCHNQPVAIAVTQAICGRAHLCSLLEGPAVCTRVHDRLDAPRKSEEARRILHHDFGLDELLNGQKCGLLVQEIIAAYTRKARDPKRSYHSVLRMVGLCWPVFCHFVLRSGIVSCNTRMDRLRIPKSI